MDYNKPDPVILSFSGGLDSTSLLMKYLSEGHPVLAVSFKYGQNHVLELERAKKNIKYLQKWGYDISHQIVDLTSAFALSSSALHGGIIPKGESYNESNMKDTVVENRNVIFSSIIYGMALSVAKKRNSMAIIAQGVHAGDHDIYPDCRSESIEMAKELYRISNWGSERIDFEAPFVHLSKGEVLKVGLDSMEKLGFKKSQIKKILSNTWSCYSPDEHGKPCGQCGTCKERAEAFATNDMIDPTL